MRFLMIPLLLALSISAPMVAGGTSGISPEVKITLRPDSDHGTCSIGFRINEGGAPLRAGPSSDYAVIAQLDAGYVVSGCDHSNGWEGVIDGQDEKCSVGIIVKKARPYDGPCPSGWIEEKYLTSIYG